MLSGRLYILLFLLVIAVPLCYSQVISLPDSLLNTSGDLPVQQPHVPTLSLDNTLFEVQPAVTFEDFVTQPASYENPFYELPEMPSEFFLHVLVLHLSKVKIPGLEAELARYNLMLDNFNRNLLEGGGYSVPYVPAMISDHGRTMGVSSSSSSGVVMSGCLDPLEAYRKWVQERRLIRARKIIHSLEEDAMPVKSDKKPNEIKLPQNLLIEDNYDVKVKVDGDNPPYRP